MSQLKTSVKHRLLLATLLSSAVLSSAGPVNAQANASTRFNYAAPLSEITAETNDIDRRTLDWRKSSLDFTFDLPASNLTDNIELLISANPQGGVNPRAPLTVQFNNEPPITLNVNGQGFDARVTLDPNKARSLRNVIRISYNAEAGADCIGPQDGGWDIDLNASKLAINSRAKRRALQFSEINAHLSTVGLAPRKVGLIAAGPNETQLQALAAQGLGLRMDKLPEFVTSRQNNDFEVIMARRSELYKYVSDDSLVAGRGAAIILPRGRPVKLVFTGDTDAEILSAVKSFAKRQLPTARRSITSLGEMSLQRPLKANAISLSSTQALSDLPLASSFSNWTGDDWASGPKSLRFDVTDPSAMTGEVLLRLASSKDVSDTSKISLKLNGKSLGTTVLDKRRKSVAFEIKAGTLRGKDNVLTLMPELNPNDTPTCYGPIGPNFHLGGGSKIILKNDTPSEITELSRMTATAMPFSDIQGAQSYIAMTGNNADFNASLKLLARLAKTSGEGLIAAQYSRIVDLSQAGNKHVLVVGPSNRLPRALVQNAPRALTDALRGQIFEGDNLISANIEQFASLDADASFKVAAQRLSQSRRIREGGVAALYPSQTSDAHVIGVITNTPGQTYVASANTISQTPYWSEIKGGVARWNTTSVLSVQAPQNVAGYALPQDRTALKTPKFNFDTSIFDEAFNKTAEFADQAWSGLKGITETVIEKVKSISHDDTNTQQPAGTAQPEAATQTAPSTAQNTPKRAVANVERVRTPVTGSEPLDDKQDWKTTAHNTLTNANTWAANASEKIRNSVESFDLRKPISKLLTRARPMGQSIGNQFKASTETYKNQNLKQNLLSPAALIVFFALFLSLIGLISAKAKSRKRRS